MLTAISTDYLKLEDMECLGYQGVRTSGAQHSVIVRSEGQPCARNVHSNGKARRPRRAFIENEDEIDAFSVVFCQNAASVHV